MARRDLTPTMPAGNREVVARPVNTFVRPASPTEAPIGPSMAEQLARSLSGFDDTLNKIAQHAEKVGKEQAEAVALKKIGGMTLEEAQEAVRNGTMAAEHNPWAQAAFDKLYGRRRANETNRSIKMDIASGKIGPDDDLDAIYAERTAADTDGIDSRFFASGYGSVIAEGREATAAVQARIKTEQFIAERDATIQSSMVADVDAGRTAGKSDDEIVASLFAYSATNKAFFNISRQDTDKFHLALAAKYAAEGDEALAVKLLNAKRPGNTPSLADNPTYALKVKQITALAEREGFDKRQVQYQDLRVQLRTAAAKGELSNGALVEGLHVGAISTDEAEDLRVRSAAALDAENKRLAGVRFSIAKDRVHDAHMETYKRNFATGLAFANRDMETEVTKADGTKVTVKTSWNQDTSDKVFSEILASDPVIQSTEEPELILRRAVRIAEANGMPHPFSPWVQTLNAGPIAASSILATGEVPPAAVASLKTYGIMRATSPALLEKHQPANSRGGKFNSIAYTLMQHRGMSAEEALLEAARLTSAPTPPMPGLNAEIEKAADTLDTGGNWWGGVDIKNRGEVANSLRAVAKTYTQLTPPEAVKAAKADLEQTGTVINGWYVPTGGRDAEFLGALPEISKTEIAKYIEQYGADQGHDDPETLVLAPAFSGGGVWLILDMSRGGRPMSDDTGKPVAIRTSDLMERHRATLAAAALAKQAEINKEQNEARDMTQRRAERIFLRRMPWEGPRGDEDEKKEGKAR